MSDLYELMYTEKMKRDIDKQYHHIYSVLKNESAADKFLERLFIVLEKLKMFPEMGTSLKKHVKREIDVKEGTRVLFIDQYKVIYHCENQKNYLNHLYHGLQDYQSKF